KISRVTEPTGEYFGYIRDTASGGPLANPDYGKTTFTTVTAYDREQSARIEFLKAIPTFLLTIDTGAALIERSVAGAVAAESGIQTLDASAIRFSQSNVRSFLPD